MNVIKSGRIHRYQHGNPQNSQTSLLEVEFAAYMDTKYCIGVNSCGCGMFLALKGLNVKQGDLVFVNAHTLTPVPSSIVHSGATPVFVECDEKCVIDIENFEQQLINHQTDGQRVLLLSHMRSRICDMSKITEICDKYDVILVEDCAHALGSTWNGKKIGQFGKVACFSCQTNKLINSGEGGLIVTNDEQVAGRIILHSGSYGYYKQMHILLPSDQVMDDLHNEIPNFSMRMTDLTAALIRPQVRIIDQKVKKLNQNYTWLANNINAINPKGSVRVPPRNDNLEGMVGSSLQFELNVDTFDQQACSRVVQKCNDRGVKTAWFGRPKFLNFTSTHRHWSYAFKDEKQKNDLQQTIKMQQNLCDIPLYHTMTWNEQDFKLIADIIQECVTEEMQMKC